MTRIDGERDGEPIVAIIVVGYNSREFLPECLGSIQALHYHNKHVVYVDNGSEDGSCEWVKGSGLASCVLETGFNAGYCGGNNAGLEAAADLGASYVLILNPDTVFINVESLASMVELMEADPRIGKLGPMVFRDTAGNVQNTIGEFPSLWLKLKRWFKLEAVNNSAKDRALGTSVRYVDSLNGCCVLVRSRAIRECGGLDSVMWGYVDEADWDYRFEKKGWLRAFIAVPAVRHLQGGGDYGLFSLPAFMQSRNTAYFFRKHGFWIQCFLWIGMKSLLVWARCVWGVSRGRVDLHPWRFATRLQSSLLAVSMAAYGSRLFGLGRDAYLRLRKGVG